MSSISFRLPKEMGKQLRALSRMQCRPVTDLVGAMLALAASQWGVDLPIDGVDARATPGGVDLKVDGFQFTTMTPVQAISLAQSIETVINRTPAMLDLDTPNLIEITRIGPGVRITVRQEGEVKCDRIFARSVAQQLVVKLAAVASKSGAQQLDAKITAIASRGAING